MVFQESTSFCAQKPRKEALFDDIVMRSFNWSIARVAWFLVSVAIFGVGADNVVDALANELQQALLAAMVRTYATEDLAAVKAWVE
ncbi:hypothetical protein Tco_1497682, partial [Tanacetum coccineum]